AGGGMVRLRKVGVAFVPEEVYFGKALKNHHGGMLLHDGCLYGATGGEKEERISALVCLDFRTGATLWESRAAGKGSVAYADGRLYYRNEDGPVLLLQPDRKGYREVGRFDQPHRSREKAWSHPVLANGKLFLRDQD